MPPTFVPQNLSSGLAHDANRTPIQIGSGFQTQDAALSPITSPLTLTGSVQVLAVPGNAVECILFPSGAMTISEIAAMTTSDQIAAGSKESVPCARMPFLYVQGSGTLYFRFTLI